MLVIGVNSGAKRTKRPPKGGLSVAPIEAENQATQPPHPPILLPNPRKINLPRAIPRCKSESVVRLRNRTDVARTTHSSLDDLILKCHAFRVVIPKPLFRGIA
jgi:hypothetical protein